MVRRNNSNKRSRRGGRRRAGRPYSAQIIVVPFTSSFDVLTPGTKQITAGDLGIDISRPLRIRSFHATATLVTTVYASASLNVCLVSDSQEGTVSRPYLLTPTVQTRIHVRQARFMDFGRYGTGGSLVLFTHDAVISGSAVTTATISITGKIVVEYQQSTSFKVVTVSEFKPEKRERESLAYETFDMCH